MRREAATCCSLRCSLPSATPSLGGRLTETERCRQVVRRKRGTGRAKAPSVPANLERTRITIRLEITYTSAPKISFFQSGFSLVSSILSNP